MNIPEGYEVPVHVAQTQPVLLAGVPRTFAIVVGTVGAAVAVGLQVPWVGIPQPPRDPNPAQSRETVWRARP